MTSSSDPFIKDRLPQDGDCVEVLCEDRRGAYVLPFPCRRTEGAWRNAGTGGALEADVSCPGTVKMMWPAYFSVD